MKTYIFFTADIHPIGGMQLYTAGKAKYLEDNGWNVIVFYQGLPFQKCQSLYLNKYVKYGLPFLSIQPTQLSQKLLESSLNRIMKLIKNVSDNDEIFIESHDEKNALWAEVLAKKLNGKHICFICNEQFRGENKYYEDNIDFFKFKYERKELLGIHKNSIQKLFEGYLDVEETDKYVFFACEGEPVQDIESNIVQKIPKKKYNIAYLGRLEKGYVPNIINGVKKFAQKYKNDTIEFIVIGDYKVKRQYIEDSFRDLENVELFFTDSLVPIPRLLYSKLDTIIAGSGCAMISAKEGIPTIVADPENYLANGILGYTVKSILYSETPESQTDFCEALENVLLKEIYKNMKFEFTEYNISPADVYYSHFKFFENSIPQKKYYNISNGKMQLEGMPKFKAILKIKFPKIYYILKIINENCRKI